jgi:hypothetical protein
MVNSKDIVKRLKQAVYQGQIRVDIDAAQNPDLRRAIHIVEQFLKSSGRVCYGGQAINANLPKKDQFYNLETSLPDYDFFSPDYRTDIRELVSNLKSAGFTEISERIGIHEGTTKIFVNYMAIADITQMDSEFYEQIHKRSINIDGIHYADPLFLKMLMYVELSRPRGMLSRWDKVYERLNLLEAAHPLKPCSNKTPHVLENKAANQSRGALLNFVLKNKRVFMGADIHPLYLASGQGKTPKSRTQYILRGKSPMVFMSPDADIDADYLGDELRARKEQVLGFQGILPAMVALYQGDMMICLIVQEEACHSNITVELTKGRVLHLASLDTLLTFLIGLYYRDDHILMASDSLLCWLRHYTGLLAKFRAHPTKTVPSFPLECSGYQTTFASLLRAKGARIEAARQRIGSGARRLGTFTAKKSNRPKRSTLGSSTRKLAKYN